MSSTSAESHVKVSVADGEMWARMYAAAIKREERLMVERDRLREALETVLNCGSVNDQWWVDKVREALEGENDE